MTEDAPPPPSRMVSVEEVRAHVFLPKTRKALRRHVLKRVTNLHADDLVQETILAASNAESRPETVKAIPGWTYGIANKKIAKFYAKKTQHAALMQKYFERWETTEPSPSEVNETKLMAGWLMKDVANDPHDAETLDLVRDHAINGLTYAEIAAERAMTVKTVDNRIGHFKTKYAYLYKSYRRRLAWLAMLAILLFAVVAYALYRLKPWLLGDVPGSIAPPTAVTATAAPPPPPSGSVFRPAAKPPASAVPEVDTKKGP